MLPQNEKHRGTTGTAKDVNVDRYSLFNENIDQ